MWLGGAELVVDSPPERHPAAERGALCGPAGHLNRAASPPDRKGGGSQETPEVWFYSTIWTFAVS